MCTGLQCYSQPWVHAHVTIILVPSINHYLWSFLFLAAASKLVQYTLHYTLSIAYTLRAIGTDYEIDDDVFCNQPLAQIQLCYFHWWRASTHDHECHMCMYLSKVSTQYLVECVVALLQWTGLAWWEQIPVIGELSLLCNALLQRVVTPICKDCTLVHSMPTSLYRITTQVLCSWDDYSPYQNNFCYNMRDQCYCMP